MWEREEDNGSEVRGLSAGISASEIPALFGCHPGGLTPNALLKEKREGRVREVDTDAVKLGCLIEDYLYDAAGKRGIPLTGGKQIKAYRGRVSATLDAVTFDGEPVEFKTAGLTGEADMAWTTGLPENVYLQVSTQMYVTDAPKAHVLALVGGVGIKHTQVVRNPEIEAEIVKRANEFLEMLDGGLWYPEAGAINRLLADIVEVPDEVIQEYMSAVEAKRESEKRHEEARSRVLSHIPFVADAVELRGKERSLVVKRESRKTLSPEFGRAYPELAANFWRVTESWRITIPKEKS